MSHHQSRVDRSSDSQPKRNSARSGAHQRASAATTLKGGGHHGPSAATAPLLSPTAQPAPLPSSKRSTGANGQTRGHSSVNHEADNQKAQQSTTQYQGQTHGAKSSMPSSNGSAPRALKTVTPLTSLGSTDPIPAISKTESAWSSAHPQLSFQFGSIGATFVHTGVQIPARTSSAPPDIDEQKQDQARYTVINAVGAKGNVPSVGQHQGVRPQSQQSGGHHQQSTRPQVQQTGAALPAGIPHAQYIHNQPHQHPVQLQIPQTNPHVQVQTNPPHIPMQTHFVPPQTQQQGLVQLPYPPVQFPGRNIPNQMLGPQFASMPPQQIHQMPHQLSGPSVAPLGPGMAGSPYGMGQVPNHFFQPRTSRAVKIVNPQTQEVLKFDSKIKHDSLNESTTSSLSQGRVAGNGQSRLNLSYANAHHHSNQDACSSQQNGVYVPGLKNYHSQNEQGTEPQKQNFTETFHGKTVSSPSIVANTGSINEENVGMSPHVATQSATILLDEDKNLYLDKSEKTSAVPILEAAEQAKENVINVEIEKNSKEQKSDSSEGLSALFIKDGGQLEEQSKEAHLDPTSLGTLTTKDTVKVPEQVKEAQGDPVLLKDGREIDSVPEISHGNKKKKKKDLSLKVHSADAQKVGKVQVEARRLPEDKVPDGYAVKSMVLKTEDQAKDQAVVPAASKEGIDSKEGENLKEWAEPKKGVDLKGGSDLKEIIEFNATITSTCSIDLIAQANNVAVATQQTEADIPASAKEDDGNELEGRAHALEDSLSRLRLEPSVNKSPGDNANFDDASSQGRSIDEQSATGNVEDVHHIGSVVLPILDISPGPDKSIQQVQMMDNLNNGTAVSTTKGEDTSGGIHVPLALDTRQGGKSEDTSGEMHVPVALDTRQGGKKKKMKDILAKADAAGNTADLYNAYKAPEEKKHEAKVSKVDDAKPSSVEFVNGSTVPDESNASKELEDWEDAVELPTPKTSSMAEAVGKGSKSANEMYTRDFLLTFKDQHLELPVDFDMKPEIIDLLVNPHLVNQQLSNKTLDRQLSGGSRRSMLDEDRWPRQPQGLHSPSWPENYIDMGPPGGFRPGGAPGLIPRMPSNTRPGISMVPISPGLIPGKPSTPSPSTGLVRPNTVDSDRWQRMPTGAKGLIPSPHNPLPAVHKAEKRYEVGKNTDEEELKQRQIKGILNKLTPQNFDKLFEKVNDVNIHSAAALNGVISQIFDKALTEPTFCEMYAKFCKQLASHMPEFLEADEKVTFKRVLLNKCQEEFHKGEKEQAEASKLEEGKELSLEEREERRIKGKRRMLGNIRFIGELYKKQMLTERIMHECIIKLLGEFENPEEEDVEALCKLVSTIGHMIDQPKAKEHMEAYFDRFDRLSHNQKLSSRIRFMLRDVIDLRRNGWQERRKVDGPKKIEEVHRDAVQERQATVAQAGRLSRGPSIGTSAGRRIIPPSDFSIRGPSSPMFSPTPPIGGSQTGGHRGLPSYAGGRSSILQDVRMEERLSGDIRSLPMPLSQRPLDEAPLTLGPQGGLGRGMRGQTEVRRFGPASMAAYSSGSVLGVERPRTPPEKPILDKPDRYVPGASIKGSRNLERTLSDRAVSTSASFAEHHQQQSSRPATEPSSVPLDEDQLIKQSKGALVEYFSARDVKEVIRCIEELRAPKFYSTMVYIWIFLVLEKKELERDIFITLLISLCKSEPFLLNLDTVFLGFEMAIENLEDFSMDVPKAPQYLIGMFKKLISEEVLSMEQVSDLIKKTDLIHSLDIVGQDTEKHGPSNIQHLENKLSEYLKGNDPVSEIEKWLEENAKSEMQSSSSFLRMLMTHVLRHSVPAAYEKEHQQILKESVSQYRKLLRRFAVDQDKQRQYIVAMQLFVHDMAHPAGLMTDLCSIFYDEEVISESAYMKWEDDVRDTTVGREQALRDVFRWLAWLKTAPELS